MIEIDPHRLLTSVLVIYYIYDYNMRYNVCSLATVTMHYKRFFPQHRSPSTAYIIIIINIVILLERLYNEYIFAQQYNIIIYIMRVLILYVVFHCCNFSILCIIEIAHSIHIRKWLRQNDFRTIIIIDY